jgi:hypothetical protein
MIAKEKPISLFFKDGYGLVETKTTTTETYEYLGSCGMKLQ